MARLEWTEALSLGVYRVDSQHMHLVEVANAFLKALEENQGDEAVEETIASLREYTVHHFHDEEDYMKEIRYPGRAEHQMEHNKLVQQVKQFQRDLYKHRGVTPEAMRDFLKEWLIGHIINTDLKIAAWLREQEKRKAAPEGREEKGKSEPDGTA